MPSLLSLIAFFPGSEDTFVTFQMNDITNLMEYSKLKRRDGKGFSRAGRAAQNDFQKGKPKGTPFEQPCQPEESPVLYNSFTQIFIFLQ